MIGLALLLTPVPMAIGKPGDLVKAERSFSPFAFGRHLPRRGLQPVNQACLGPDCEFRDAHGVRHIGGQENEIAIKVVGLRQFGAGSLAALGIGRVRTQEAVLGRVRAFLPTVALQCSPGRGMGSGIETDCRAQLGQGWITLTFDHKRRLHTVRVDAYQIN